MGQNVIIRFWGETGLSSGSRNHLTTCVLHPCFNAQPDNFAVMNCCVVTLSLFSSDILTWSPDSLFSAMKPIIRRVHVDQYCVLCQTLRQNVALETWIWRQIVTSLKAHTKDKWPPYATEWTPPWKFSACATGCAKRKRISASPLCLYDRSRSW